MYKIPCGIRLLAVFKVTFKKYCYSSSMLAFKQNFVLKGWGHELKRTF